MQVELLEAAEDGSDVAVREAAQATEGSFGVDQRFAFESSADEIDDVVWEMGDVAEGLVLDLAVLAEGSAQQVGMVGLVSVAARGGGYVYCTVSGWNLGYFAMTRQGCQQSHNQLVATYCTLIEQLSIVSRKN